MSERPDDRLIDYANKEQDKEAGQWLEDFIAAAYAVVDSWEFGNLAENVTELGELLPVRGLNE